MLLSKHEMDWTPDGGGVFCTHCEPGEERVRESGAEPLTATHSPVWTQETEVKICCPIVPLLDTVDGGLVSVVVDGFAWSAWTLLLTVSPELQDARVVPASATATSDVSRRKV